MVVAMSGGVDSSVAAALLADQGHDVIGLSMQLYDQRERRAQAFGSCCTLDDLHDARRVAAAISIPHYILNFERQFQEQVISNFVREYTAGRTPLPCAHCNSDLKFATLVDRARGFGADAVATGHYARVERDAATGRWLLKRGADPAKDQSYFLFSLTQEQLARARVSGRRLPEGRGARVRAAPGLPVADKPDSQEICFVPDDDYAAFVTQARAGRRARRRDRRRGRHACSARHGGIHRFTVGQRKGSACRPRRRGAPDVRAGARPADRQVVVGPKAALERTRLDGVRRELDSSSSPSAPLRVAAQIRHRHPAAPATVRALATDAPR